MGASRSAATTRVRRSGCTSPSRARRQGARRSSSTRRRRGRSGSDRAGDRPGPARTRSSAVARDSRPSGPAGEPRPCRSGPRLRPRDRRAPRATPAPAIAATPRRRAASRASASRSRRPIPPRRGARPFRGLAPGDRARASNDQRGPGAGLELGALRRLVVGEEAEALDVHALEQHHPRIRLSARVHGCQRHRFGRRFLALGDREPGGELGDQIGSRSSRRSGGMSGRRGIPLLECRLGGRLAQLVRARL